MSSTPRPLYRELARIFQAYGNCRDMDEISEWEGKHCSAIDTLCERFLPSGSGFDHGTKFDFVASKPNRLVLLFVYHHMNELGCYCGWTEHTCIVCPDLMCEFCINITGSNRNGVKDFFYDVFNGELAQMVQQGADGSYQLAQAIEKEV